MTFERFSYISIIHKTIIKKLITIVPLNPNFQNFITSLEKMKNDITTLQEWSQYYIHIIVEPRMDANGRPKMK